MNREATQSTHDFVAFRASESARRRVRVFASAEHIDAIARCCIHMCRVPVYGSFARCEATACAPHSLSALAFPFTSSCHFSCVSGACGGSREPPQRADTPRRDTDGARMERRELSEKWRSTKEANRGRAGEFRALQFPFKFNILLLHLPRSLPALMIISLAFAYPFFIRALPPRLSPATGDNNTENRYALTINISVDLFRVRLFHPAGCTPSGSHSRCDFTWFSSVSGITWPRCQATPAAQKTLCSFRSASRCFPPLFQSFI